jgi:dihydropteroate synthase
MLTQAAAAAYALDDRLSNRFIELDEGGYFLIYTDRPTLQICADHYSNTIDPQGIACDPETGEPLPCNVKLTRQPTTQFRAQTAKALCIEIFEQDGCPVTRLDHAAYLGRELVRAELALYGDSDAEYIQD